MNASEWTKKGIEFIREARFELAKVTWPSRKETVAATFVVLFTVFFTTIFLGFVDYLLVKVMKAIYG